MSMPVVAISAARVRQARKIFRRHGGIMRMAEALRAGIDRKTLYAMRDAGMLEQLGRGLYRVATKRSLGNPDLVTVALKVPKGVICLISALAFYELTTQVPHEVYLAIPRNSEPPRLDFPPVRVFRFNSQTYSEGIEQHLVDAVPVRIYSREKSVADCFKYRHKIGLDVAVEALRRYRDRGKLKIQTLLHYASVCRVMSVMRPYLEAVV